MQTIRLAGKTAGLFFVAAEFQENKAQKGMFSPQKGMEIQKRIVYSINGQPAEPKVHDT
jgi:hypothetical protein